MKVRDIINNIPGTNSANTKEKIGKFQSTVRQLNHGNKYRDRKELTAAGIAKLLDTQQSNIRLANEYEKAARIAGHTLRTQLEKLLEIKAVITEFTPGTPPERQFKESEEEIANECLKKIEEILNSTENGEYIFGGKNAKVKPVTNSLPSQSNLINGRVTANYTSASSARVEVRVSHQDTVNTGFLSAADPAISKLIAAINIYKSSKGLSKVSIDECLNEGVKQLERLEVKLGYEIEKASKAEVINSDRATEAKIEVQNLSAADVEDLAEDISAICQGLKANSKISEVTGLIRSAMLKN